MENRLAILFFFLLLFGCRYDDITPPVMQIYLEGQMIPGTAMHFPQGENVDLYLYGGEPLLPKISPDGTKLLYTGDLTLGNRGLWVMDLATQEKTLIIIDGRNADWGPDSQWIYFNQYDLQIYKGKTDGTSIEQMTFDGTNIFPVCSPDGNYILYANDDTKNNGVTLITTQGTHMKLVLPNLPYYPAWFPDQKSFLANDKTYDTTGTEISDLHFNLKYGPWHSSISPLDKRIVRTTISGIYIANPDGSALKRILPNHLYNPDYHNLVKLWAQNASWHPDGRHIVYEHFAIDEAVQTDDGLYIKGTMSFYKVDADSAIMVSNLELNDN